MALTFLTLIVSVAALAWSADKFVESAAALAKLLGMSSVVVGAVVIGFGTSIPEAVASGLAAKSGNIDVAVGNVLGSNAANLSLVVAISALFATIPVVWKELRREFILTGIVWGWFAISILNGHLSRIEGGIGLAMAVGAVIYSIAAPNSKSEELEESTETSKAKLCGAAIGWLGILSVAAHFLVESSLTIANNYGLSGGFAGAALVAVGTSLPEVFTAAASARQKDFQMLAGNVLGSNLFNAGFVGGIAGLIGPGSFSTVLSREINAVALGIGIAILAIALTRKAVTKPIAVALLGAFGLVLYLSAQS